MAKAGGKPRKRPAFKRTSSQKMQRATQEKLERQSGVKLPIPHKWMLEMTTDLQKLSEASNRLTEQERHGLPPVILRVMGAGGTPTECIASSPEMSMNAPSQQLYQRLCELEAVRSNCAECMEQIFEELLSRGYIVAFGEPAPDSE